MRWFNFSITVASVFLWIGFVLAISFMEAWLKFKGPGITIPLGLGIGRLVFAALNKVEWFLFAVVFINMVIAWFQYSWGSKGLLIILFLVLILQTFLLLPQLDIRAQMQIDGETVQPSFLHLYYVLFEIVKVSALSCFAIIQFKTQKINYAN